MYCWPVQTSSRKCKMINDMFNQISKFHLAQLLDWKIHFGSLLTMVVEPSLAYIRQFSILVRNISGQNVDVSSDSPACLLVMMGHQSPLSQATIRADDPVTMVAPQPGPPHQVCLLCKYSNLRDNDCLLSHPADWRLEDTQTYFRNMST